MKKKNDHNMTHWETKEYNYCKEHKQHYVEVCCWCNLKFAENIDKSKRVKRTKVTQNIE